jgi:hypothetical protein
MYIISSLDNPLILLYHKFMIDTKRFIAHPEEFEIKIALMPSDGMVYVGYRVGDIPGLEIVNSERAGCKARNEDAE